MFASHFGIGLLLACFATFLVSSFAIDEVNEAANTVIIRGNDTSVLLEGQAGKISTIHFEQDDDDDDDDVNDDEDEVEDFSDDNENALTFQVESLQERNAAGAAVGLNPPSPGHGVSSLAAQKFDFSPLDNSSMYQGIPVKKINLSTILNGPDANLNLMVLVFLRAGTVTFGNETFRVQSGTMKFNIMVSNWKFCDGVSVSCLSQNNQQEIGQYLDLALSIKSQAEEPEEVDDEQRTQSNKPAICVDPEDPTEQDDDCPIIYNMGSNSEMVLNRGVLTDNGNYVAMPTGFPKFETTGMMNKRLIFRIPKFNDSVIIDPSVNVGAPTKNQQSGAGHNSATSSLQFFSFVLFLSMFMVHC